MVLKIIAFLQSLPNVGEIKIFPSTGEIIFFYKEDWLEINTFDFTVSNGNEVIPFKGQKSLVAAINNLVALSA